MHRINVKNLFFAADVVEGLECAYSSKHFKNECCRSNASGIDIFAIAAPWVEAGLGYAGFDWVLMHVSDDCQEV